MGVTQERGALLRETWERRKRGHRGVESTGFQGSDEEITVGSRVIACTPMCPAG